MMRRILRAIGSAIGITVIVALVLSLCLWFLGPFLGFGDTRPFDGVLGRLVGLAVLWIGALLVILVILIRGGKRDEKLADDIVASVELGSGGRRDGDGRAGRDARQAASGDGQAAASRSWGGAIFTSCRGTSSSARPAPARQRRS